MAWEWLYQQGRELWRSENQIRQDLEKKFKSIDRTWIRDDQEIYISAKKVIDDYIDEIKKSKNESYWSWALEVFLKLQKDILKFANALEGIKLTSSNKNKIQINDLANKIDDAENIITQRLALDRATKVNYNANEKQKEIGKNYFSRDSKTNVMTFQKDVNKPKIHEVLPQLGLKDNEVYRIDYINCKDQNIRNKMVSMIWWNECTIMYNSKTKTYNIRGMDGKIIDTQRAYIYEWVTLVSEKIKSLQSQAQLKSNEQLQLQKLQSESKSINSNANFEALLQDKKRWPILKELQATWPKLYHKLQKESSKNSGLIRKFLAATEQRLDGVVVYAKKNNRNLQAEPISKLSVKRWLMEVHLIARNGTAEQDVILFKDDKVLGEELYDMIDKSYEEEYKNFLSSRITKKMDRDYAKFTKKENLDLTTQTNDTKKLTVAEQQEQKKVYTPDQKEVIIDWLLSLRSMLQSMKAEFGNTWNDDDKEMEKMMLHLDNALYSLEQNKVLTEGILVNKILGPLKHQRKEFASHNIQLWKKLTLTEIDTLFSSLRKAEKITTRSVIRSLWNDVTTFGNTHTSHLADDIIHDKDLTLKDKKIDLYFKNISQKLELNEDDETKNINQKRLIDILYTAQDWIWLKRILQNNALLPQDKDLSSKQLQKVLEKCMQLREQLLEQQKAFDTLPKTVDDTYLASIKKDFYNKKIKLEAKTDKTEDDYVELQTYIIMEQNPDILLESAQTALSAMKDQMKYANIDHLVKWTIGSTLIDMSDGIKSWKSADMYNDIKWHGWLNLSDENAKFVWEMGKMIVEEIAFTLAVIALTATTGVWWAALVAGRVSLSWARNLNKLRKWKRILSFAKSITKTKKVQSALKAWDDVADSIKLLNAGKKSTEVVKVVNKTTDMAKVVNKTTDIAKVIDKTKDITKVVDTFDDVSKVSKLGKVSKNVGAYLNKLNPLQRKTLFADLDKMLTRGALHQLIAKTYRGQLDDSTSTWITDILKSSGMYGVLWVVGRWANSGLLGQAAAKVHPWALSLTKLAAEEWLMFGTDFVVDITMGTDPMPTMAEIAQNIGIWLGAEFLPYIGKIKTLRIGKDKIKINNIDYSPAVLLKEINDVKVLWKNNMWNENIVDSDIAKFDDQRWLWMKEGNDHDLVDFHNEVLKEMWSMKPEERKKFYRSLAKKLHSDLNPWNIFAEEQMKQLSEVYKMIEKFEQWKIAEFPWFKKKETWVKIYKNESKNTSANWESNSTAENNNITPQWTSVLYESQMDKAAKGIADNIFNDIPTSKADAIGKAEQFGIWLWKTKVWPTLKFFDDAMKWVQSLELKFPDMKAKIDSIKKSLRESAMKRHIQIIESYSAKSFDEKVKLWDANRTKDLPLDVLQTFHKIFTGEKVDIFTKTTRSLKGETSDDTWKRQLKDRIDQSVRDQTVSENFEAEKMNSLKTINSKIANIQTQLDGINKKSNLILEWKQEKRLLEKEILNLYMQKKKLLGKEISKRLSLRDAKAFIEEARRDQRIIDNVIKKYPRLNMLSEQLVIKDYVSAKEHIEDLNLLPDEILERIAKTDIIMFLWKGTVTEWGHFYDLRWVQPRGRKDWETRDVVPWLCRGNEVVAWVGRHWSISIILHELSHSIDNRFAWSQFRLSHTEQFKSFHEQFYHKLWSYLQQGWPWWYAWCEELFAESFAQFYKYWEKKFVKIYSQEFANYMKSLAIP